LPAGLPRPDRGIFTEYVRKSGEAVQPAARARLAFHEREWRLTAVFTGDARNARERAESVSPRFTHRAEESIFLYRSRKIRGAKSEKEAENKWH